MTDHEVLARTLWGEARGEGRLGQEAVASVICNRADLARAFVSRRGRKHPLYGDGTLASACRVPWQFSCWNKDDPNRVKVMEVTAHDKSFAQCLDVAALAESGELEDPTMGATHYHTVKNPPGVKNWPPRWADGLTNTTVIGAHAFYR